MQLDFTKELLERLLFRKILTDKTYTMMLSSDFDSRWIETEHLGKIAKLCLNFYKKHNVIPNLKIVKAIVSKYCSINSGVDEKHLLEIIDESVSLDFGAENENVISENLINFIRKQALWTSMMDNADEIDKNPDAVLDNCLSRFDKINKLTLSGKDLGMSFFDDGDLEKHWDTIRNPEDRIPTGWSALDIYINGGVWRKGRCLAGFMGQAGLGKSLFLSNMAFNYLKEGLKVVVISLEMSQDVYAMRFDAHISGNDINHLRETEKSSIKTIKEFYKSHPTANLYIKEYPPRSIRCHDIEMYLDNLKMAGKDFDVVIIDYLNLVLPNHSTDSMYRDIQAVSEQLRSLSYKYECPFWTATQANREGMNNENIDLQNISESSGIAHTLDFLGGLFQTPDDRENGFIKMRILKNRLGGKVGKLCTFKVNPNNLIVDDITLDPDQANSSSSAEADAIANRLNDLAFEIQ